MAEVTEITIVSGKGGTGKTSVAGGLARLLQPAVLADYDVDAADLALILNARRIEGGLFHAGWEPVFDPALCTGCGRCIEVCRREAISAGRIVSPQACEGCGACALVCAAGAIGMKERVAGEWLVSETACGTLVHAELGPGRENSGKLVAKVKAEARRLAALQGRSLLLGDGPPGIGCAAIAGLSGAQIALVVTEPSLTARHDLERVLVLCRNFRVKSCVCVNKWDLWRQGSTEIEKYCRERGVEVVGKLPYDATVAYAARLGVTVMEAGSARIGRAMATLAGKLRSFIPALSTKEKVRY